MAMRSTKTNLMELDVYEARIANQLSNLTTRYPVIDLFSGAGGLSAGFHRFFDHAFETSFALDFAEDCTKSFEVNFGSCAHTGDILELIENNLDVIPKARLVIGGPPCQGFSLLNKKRAGDIRKSLWRPFLEVVLQAEADVFLMENVPQLLGTEEHAAIVAFAERHGFAVRSAKLCAADYGVPQTRWRAFIVGVKGLDPLTYFPPKKTHFDPRSSALQLDVSPDVSDFIPNPHPWATVRDAIGDLPVPSGTEIRDEEPPLDLHFGRTPTPKSLARYRAIPEQGMNRFDLQKLAPELTPQCWINKKSGGTDLFGRLWWDRPAFTIRTEFFKPEKGRYLHPTQHRPITHREAARLQSFPDGFLFKGTKIQIARQIGNAVPPLLSSRLADSILAILLEIDGTSG